MLRSHLNLLNAHVEIYDDQTLLKEYTVRDLAIKYGRDVQDDYDELERVGLTHFKETEHEHSSDVE